MKILIFSEFYYPNLSGGAEISTQLLAEELVKMGNEIVVCTTSNQDSRSTINGVRIYYLRANPLYWTYKKRQISVGRKVLWHIIDLYNVFILPKLKKIIETECPQIIHTSTISQFSCAVWKFAKDLDLPVCHTIRDFYLLCLKCTLYNRKNCDNRCKSCQLFGVSKKILSKNVDAVIGISKFMLDKHYSYGLFPNARISDVIPNPFVQETVSTQANYYNIGYLGSLLPSKGVEELINAFIHCSNKEFTLLIAGDGRDDGYINYLKKLSKGYNVKFLGRVNPTDFYTKIGVLVIPSLWHEPFGRVVVEAIASGIPVIASDRGGIPDILKNRNEGILYDASDDKALISLLRKYMDNELNFDFSKVEEFKTRYSQTHIAKSYLNLYKKLL